MRSVWKPSMILKWVEIKACNANTLTTHRILPLPIVTIVTSCKNLKFITVYQLSLKKEWFSSEISNFPLLEYLQITECHGVESIRIWSPCLKTLILKCWMELIEAKIETHNLKYVRIGWSGIINFECFVFVRSNSLFAPMLWSQHSMVVEYIELPAMSQKFLKLLSLQCRMVEPDIVVYTWSMREWKYVQFSRL